MNKKIISVKLDMLSKLEEKVLATFSRIWNQSVSVLTYSEVERLEVDCDSNFHQMCWEVSDEAIKYIVKNKDSKLPVLLGWFSDKENQHCCGYAFIEDYKRVLNITHEESRMLSLNLMYSEEFLLKLNYTQMECNHSDQMGRPKEPRVGDIIVFLNKNSEPKHYMKVYIIEDSDIYIDHKVGLDSPERVKWEDVFSKFKNHEYNYMRLENYVVYRKHNRLREINH